MIAEQEKIVARALCSLFGFNLPFCKSVKGWFGDDFERFIIETSGAVVVPYQ